MTYHVAAPLVGARFVAAAAGDCAFGRSQGSRLQRHESRLPLIPINPVNLRSSKPASVNQRRISSSLYRHWYLGERLSNKSKAMVLNERFRPVSRKAGSVAKARK